MQTRIKNCCFWIDLCLSRYVPFFGGGGFVKINFTHANRYQVYVIKREVIKLSDDDDNMCVRCIQGVKEVGV